ncbi:MAG TPA: amidohydrolase, partial [Sphingomicrobium sp.]|nr:amidohydrolase [Sphingomicrobium sp.]
MSLPMPADASTLSESIRSDMPQLMALYRDLHANPELSMQETRTPAKLAPEMRKLGFEVTEHVGKTGVVAVL